MSALGRYIAASHYARAGLAVLPLHTPDHAGVCSCPAATDCASAGKHPRLAGGVHAASTDIATVRRWWDQWPDANVGVATGKRSSLVVVDIDNRHGGTATLATLEAQFGSLAGGRVRTGDGLHIWLGAAVRDVANSAGRLGPGIDIRGEGGYVVAPPSAHHGGATYAWISALSLPLPPCPDWLSQRLCAIERRDRFDLRLRRPISTATTEEWIGKVVEHEAAQVAMAVEGTRNDTLNRAAWRLGGLAGRGLLSPQEAASALGDAASSAGLGPAEARSTIASGLRAGMSHHRRRSMDSGVEIA